MYGALIPCTPDIKSAVPVKRQLAKTGNDAKSSDGGAFGSVLATAVTAKTTDPPASAKDTTTQSTTAKDSKTDPDANTANTAAMLQQASQLLPPPSGDPQPATTADQTQASTAIGTVTATGSAGGQAATLASAALTTAALPTAVSTNPVVDPQTMLTAASLTPVDSQPAATPTPATSLSGTVTAAPLAVTPNLAPVVQASTPTLTTLQTQDAQVSTQTTATPVLAATQPVVTDQAAQVKQQQPMPTPQTTDDLQAAAAPADNLAANQTTQAPAVKTNLTHGQVTVTVNPAPVVQPQPVVVAPVQPASAAQTIVTAAQDSKPGDNADTLAAGNLFNTDTTGDKSTTASDAMPQFAGILEQQTAKVSQPVDQSSDVAQAARPDPNNIAGQIVEQARLITRAQNSEMVIKLKPEHLGELTMRIVVENGTVSASFHSSNSDVRAALESSQLQFKQDMADQGIKVNHVGIYASLDQFSDNQQRSNSQQQAVKIAPRSQDGQEAAEAAEAVSSVAAASLTGNSAVDYRI